MAFLQSNLSRSLKNKILIFLTSNLVPRNVSQRILKIQVTKDISKIYLLKHYFYGIPVNPSIEEQLKIYGISTQWDIM